MSGVKDLCSWRLAQWYYLS